MNRPQRVRTDPDEMRARILEVAEEYFRRVGYQKTSVADIAAELGMSPANIYRFFPSKSAINESICGRVTREIVDLAFSVARTRAPASEKLDRLLMAVHRHNKATLIKEKRTHDMVVAAMEENWPVIKAHVEQLVTIIEGVIREGVEAGEFSVDDPAETARAVKLSFLPFFHPLLIQQCVEQGEDTEANLRVQIRFILKALGAAE